MDVGVDGRSQVAFGYLHHRHLMCAAKSLDWAEADQIAAFKLEDFGQFAAHRQPGRGHADRAALEVAGHGERGAGGQPGDAAFLAVRPVEERASDVQQRFGAIDPRQPGRLQQRAGAVLVLEGQIEIATADPLELEVDQVEGGLDHHEAGNQDACAHGGGEDAGGGSHPVADHASQHHPPAA